MLKESVYSDYVSLSNMIASVDEEKVYFKDTQNYLEKRKEKKIKKEKSNKISKGKALKYQVFEKLQNFLASDTNAAQIQNRKLFLANIFKMEEITVIKPEFEDISIL